MSHSKGQITEDNQKSPAGQESSPIEDKTDSDVSLLSDADYEFLFNQLLEGVAHGWHDRKIIKFFNRLGDRGKQENWVAWLERLRPKVITLPIQSKRQLGTIMIRLGELTQSASEVSQIGTASNHVGRELLFGNTNNAEDVVWEYVGPDLIVDSPVTDVETEEDLSERLPENFAELGANAAVETSDTNQSNESAPEELPLIDLDFLEQVPAEDLTTEEQIETDLQAETVTDLSSESIAEAESTLSIIDELTLELTADSDATSEPDDVSPQTEKLTPDSTFDDEFEFELDNQESEEEKPANILDSVPNFSPQTIPQDNNLVSQELPGINSTSEDKAKIEDLNQEMSEKLDVSQKQINSPIEKQLNDFALSSSKDLDQSSIELIEGWFNLGLKQVSSGEFDKAIASWEKALNINPHLSEAWHNRGSALGRLGKYEEAVESFQKALAIDPNNYQAWSDRAHALYQLKNWSAAADSWSNAIKITPGNHLFWYNRGCALEQLESWAESISSYEKSLEIKPDFQPARSRYTNLITDNSRSN